MNVQGKLIVKEETKEYGSNGFRKREFVLETQSEYPQTIMLELTQDNCQKLEPFNIGDEIKASININGRKWTNPEGVDKFFNSIQAWKLEKIGNDDLPN